MTTIDAIILGIVQGLTEFLPVSSSGHLKLAQHFLGLQNLDHYLLFDLACHLGTLIAIGLFFFQAIRNLFVGQTTHLRQVVLATLPLFPLVLLMKPIEAAYAEPAYLGVFFLMTAAILFLGVYYGKTSPEGQRHQHVWRDALVIGSWQALAILPGVSRSGSTISGARLLGWSPQEAIVFSFLLAIPAVLGGTSLELLKLWAASGICCGSLTRTLSDRLFCLFYCRFGRLAVAHVSCRSQQIYLFCLVLFIFRACHNRLLSFMNGEPLAKVRLVAFRRFCQPSGFGANPLLSRVCGFAPNAEF